MLVQASMILWTTKYGLGIPPAAIMAQKINPVPLIKLTPYALFMALVAAGLSKLSFFITLIRVCSKRWQKAALWVVAVHSTVLVFGGSILGFVDCNFYRRPDGKNSNENCMPERTGKILALTVLMHGAIVVSDLPLVCLEVLRFAKLCRRNSFCPSYRPCCSGISK